MNDSQRTKVNVNAISFSIRRSNEPVLRGINKFNSDFYVTHSSHFPERVVEGTMHAEIFNSLEDEIIFHINEITKKSDLI